MGSTKFDAEFWPKPEKVFENIAAASSSQGKSKARSRADNDQKLFNQYWEGKHLNKYLYFLVSDNGKYKSDGDQYSLNWKKLDSKLKDAGCNGGITALRDAHGQKSIGVKKLQNFFRGFALYHGFKDLPIPRAILHFLEFCLDHNGGVMSAYYEKPDSNESDQIETAKNKAKETLRNIVRDLRSYITPSVSDEDWLSASNETAIPFVGRKDELSALNDFAKGHPKKGKFQVWAMVGPSGAGKTRLLNHWVKPIKQDGWTHIKITPDSKISWDGWVPEAPTIISIDYIYGYDEEIAAIIANAKDAEFEHPVRLLLLDHATPDTMEELLRNPRWGFDDRGADNFVANEKSLFFKTAPLKLVVPDENDKEHLEKYDEFLAEIICAVAFRGDDKPSEPINEPEIQHGLAYLQKTTGARQALFAALVGYAIRQKKEGDETVEDYFEFNRRDLIKYYFRGSNRLTWRLKGKDKKIGKWAACCIAAATAVRGANFRSLIQAMPQGAQDAVEDTEKFKSLCHGVVSGNDKVELKAYEPDILGETFFLMFLENCPDIEKHLPKLIASEKGEARDYSAVEFVAFTTRLARNLSNDDQGSGSIIQCWDQLTDLLQSKAFSENVSFRWAISIACFEIYLILKDKGQKTKANIFLNQVSPNDLYQPPANLMHARHIWMALMYDGIQRKETEPAPALLVDLASRWDNGEDRDYTGLMLSLWAENSLFAKQLINDGADVDKVGLDGWTALMFACRYDQKEVALTLVKKDANLKAQDNDDWTALMFACRHDQKEVALALVKKDANLKAHNKNGVTALMFACGHDQPKVALALVEKNANLEAHDNGGMTALMFACRYDQKEVALALVKMDANLEAHDNGGMTALMFACRYDQKEVALALVKMDANLKAHNNDGMTALMIACRYDQKEVALALVKKDANLKAHNKNGVTALMFACGHDQPKVALALVEKNANLEAHDNGGMTALMIACSFDQPEVALALVKKDANLKAHDNGGMTALMFACRYDQKEVALALVEKNANLEAQNNDDWTALMIACRYDQKEVALALVKMDANLKAHNNDGMTALMFACSFDQPEVALALVKKDANLKAHNNDGMTALMCACSFDQPEVALALVKKDANLKAHNNDGVTALMFACSFDQPEVALALVEKGVFDRKNIKEQEALDSFFAIRYFLDEKKDVVGNCPWVEQQLNQNIELGGWQEPKLDIGSWRSASTSQFKWICLQLYQALSYIKKEGILKEYTCRRIRLVDLTFYPGHVLADIELYSSSAEKINLCSMVVGEKSILLLNGTSTVIHKINPRLLNLCSTISTINYLEFFCKFVRGSADGNEDSFHIISDAREIPLLDVQSDSDTIKHLKDSVFPLTYQTGSFETEGWQQFKACVLFSNAVFSVHFRVFSDGQVDLLDGNTIASDLSVLQHEYNGFFRSALK